MDHPPFMLTLIMFVVLVAVPTGIALRAKPLGEWPYRWATFLGVSSVASSPLILVSAFLAFAAGHLFGGLMFVVEVVLSVWACIGLLQRRRVGIVVYAVLWAIQIMSRPFLEMTPSNPVLQTITSNPPSVSEIVRGATVFPGHLPAFLFTVIPTVLSYIYFKNRWRLMADHTP